MAEALVNYQLRLLTAMNGISDKVDRVNPTAVEDHTKSSAAGGQTGIAQIDAMLEKLNRLENGDKKIQLELDGVKADFEAMSKRLKQGIVSPP